MATLTDFAALFERVRPRLFGIAYRMLGTIEDGEDMVQETFLRGQQADWETIREPEGWLVSVVTRMSIDRLRRAKTEREAYIGQWLPEPLPTGDWASADQRTELASDLSVAFLLMLERLAPEERAALLLREVFDCGYPEISRVLDKSEAASRQMVHRARIRVQRDKPRFEVAPEVNEGLVNRFLAALHAEDREGLLALVAEDAVWTADGGGKVAATRNTVHGADSIIRMLFGFQGKELGRLSHRLAWLNGSPAWVSFFGDQLYSATSFQIEDGRITGIYRVLNPDKLRHVARGVRGEK